MRSILRSFGLDGSTRQKPAPKPLPGWLQNLIVIDGL